jgi:competence protein ComEA
MDLSKRELLLIGLIVILLVVNIGLILKIESSKKGDTTIETLDSLFVEDEEYSRKEIFVYVTGEVKENRVVCLQDGARMVDAVDAVGGALETADLDRINLAKLLQDGERIYVPAIGEIADNYTEMAYNEEDAVININTASASQLETLQGIGPVLAQRIVDYREKEGGFQKPEDIMRVSGIGIKIFENLKDSIRVR